MPFIFHDKNKIFDDLKEKYSENNRLYNDFLIYFENQWIQYFYKIIIF